MKWGSSEVLAARVVKENPRRGGEYIRNTQINGSSLISEGVPHHTGCDWDMGKRLSVIEILKLICVLTLVCYEVTMSASQDKKKGGCGGI